MKVYINDVLEKLTENGSEPKKYIIKKLKTENHNIHAVLVDLEDDKSEMLVAISVLQDKSRFRLIKIR